jgi:hypothetical protein
LYERGLFMKKDLGGLGLAVVEVWRIIEDYGKREGHSPVLLERFLTLERSLLIEHFKGATDKPVRKPAKKSGSGKPVVSDASDKSDKSDKSTRPDPLKVGPGTNQDGKEVS